MALNLSDAEQQRDFGATIPDGSYCKVRLALKPGGHNLAGFDGEDLGLFKLARPPSDAVMIEAELTVLPPSPHQRRKIFMMWTVAGGSLDEKGQSKAWNITKAALRAMVDSALGLDPTDESAPSKAARQLPSFRSLDGIEFYARISIESDPNGVYPDSNRVGHIVVPGEPEYAALAAGQIPEPRPSRSTARRASSNAAGAGGQKPAWQQNAAPAQAAPAAAAKPAWAAGSAPAPAAAPAAPPAAAPAAPAAAGPAWLRQ